MLAFYKLCFNLHYSLIIIVEGQYYGRKSCRYGKEQQGNKKRTL